MTSQDIPQSDTLSVTFDGHVATVWLDRPEKRNAFAPVFWREFPAIIETLGDDSGVRVIVIAAKGPSFTAGIDLIEFGPLFMEAGPEGASGVEHRMELYRTIKRMQSTFTALADCPKPVIAAIHGHCIGAGVDLITACDIRYAADDAVFSVRETRMAMVADVGTLQRLPKIVNAGVAAEMIYSGADFSAAQALEVGLVTKVVHGTEAMQTTAAELAATIAASSPLAVQGAKAVLSAGSSGSIEGQLDYVALWNAAFLQSNDLTEAVSAYVERRKPDFTGR